MKPTKQQIELFKSVSSYYGKKGWKMKPKTREFMAEIGRKGGKAGKGKPKKLSTV